jgi:hypothetical protein
LGLAGVLLVEIGSIFGLLLASGLDAPRHTSTTSTEGEREPRPQVDQPISVQPETAPQTAESEPVATEITAAPPQRTTKRKRGRPAKVAVQSLEKLKAIAHDGKVSASHSTIADALGVSKATAHRQLRSLEKTGALRLKTGRRGTLIRLM